MTNPENKKSVKPSDWATATAFWQVWDGAGNRVPGAGSPALQTVHAQAVRLDASAPASGVDEVDSFAANRTELAARYEALAHTDTSAVNFALNSAAQLARESIDHASTLRERDRTIADRDAEIVRLTAQLARLRSRGDDNAGS